MSQPVVLRLPRLVALVALATSAAAQLFNGGFEQDGGGLADWTPFNNTSSNVAAVEATPYEGDHVARISGGLNGSPNYSGLYQNLPALPGQVWEARCNARHNTGAALTGTSNTVVMKIEFYRIAGGLYGSADFLEEHAAPILSATSPVDVWTAHVLQATAPSGAVEARLSFVFTQVGGQSGAALLDAVSLVGADTSRDWTLIWRDEFDEAAVDTAKWRVEDLHQIKNNELQYYAPDEVFVRDGRLVLRSRRRVYSGFDSNGVWRTFNYTSGLVETRNRFNSGYGRIEVRGKLPRTRGLWPAHWMLPASGEWPPEIDIMELLGHDPTRVYMTHHWGEWPAVQSHGGNYTGPDFTAGFHTFAVVWTPTRLDWSVDGVVRFTSTTAVPSEPFFIILNTAVGGDWPGNPDATTVFPQLHEIDYVRVFVPTSPGTPVATAVDDSAATAVADGALAPGEYPTAFSGINSGLADRIGHNSRLHIDSGGAGELHLAFESASPWPSSGSYGAVIYVDSEPGGFAASTELSDSSDLPRRLASGRTASGDRAPLYFAPGFLADYAICVLPTSVTILRLTAGEHQTINGALLGASADFNGRGEVAYRLDDGSLGQRFREMVLPLSRVGAGPLQDVRLFVTQLNGDTAFRTNEFIGVASGNIWDGVNPARNPVMLKPGDFARFRTAPRRGDANRDGAIDAADLAELAGCLGGPDAAVGPDCLGNFDFDVDGDSDVSDFAALQTAVGG